jgi:hypothetical protein
MNSLQRFSPTLWLSFILLIVSFDVQKLFNLMQSYLSIITHFLDNWNPIQKIIVYV